ncbi:hypothetical protein BO71DRAFT_373275 [Aspergillus ellipticus CBS 707.79]|uniref:Uncharacterized protein n=1 Tax=Aspergillus ellipticus CBS 707.79 TaxID=1448320 RepID=A0A319DIW2_9EURO|nr:hypothetical protein BO71DRAFT_373275 [Aspergillus ellipticus CBS 707.79]
MNPPPPLRDDPQQERQRAAQRGSYQAPTRASLARSNSTILDRTASLSPTRSSRKAKSGMSALGLRDRKALRPSSTSAASPLDHLKRKRQSPVSSFSGRRSSGLGAFAAPPRRVSTRITASDLIFRSPAATQEIREESTLTDTPENQLASELDSATGHVGLNGDFNQPSFHQILDEPDLPPTPTQLGLERPPGRPKGILSSSPNSQQGHWGIRNTDGPDQTPSKLRSVDYGEAEGSAESGFVLDRVSVPELAPKKRKLRSVLLSEVQQLKRELVELEAWSKDLGQVSDDQDDDNDRDLTRLIALLAAVNPTQRASAAARSNNASISSIISSLLPFAAKGPPTPPLEAFPANEFALEAHTQTRPFFTALAPLNLTAFSNSMPRSTPDLVERHTLSFSPPPPFPSIRYKTSVNYDVNPEVRSLISVSVSSLSENGDSRMPEYLRRWIEARLANPLLRLDVTGLCWGINRYWEASVSRAELWSRMERQHAEFVPDHTQLNNGVVVQYGRSSQTTSSAHPPRSLNTSDLRHVLPHIERTSMLFESREGSLKVLLSCELIMDEWTCEPELAADISVSVLIESEGGSRHKVEQESKSLFQAMLEENRNNDIGSNFDEAHADVIMRATECTLSALFGLGAEE